MGKNILAIGLGGLLALLGGLGPARALVPLEGLMLGDLSDSYREESKDPISAIFQKPLTEGTPQEFRRELAMYRAYVQEGLNLRDSCRFRPDSSYSSLWAHDQAVRALMATMQYLGLDLTVRAIAQYAKHFQFDDGQYARMVDGLMGNYCSRNLSIIGLKALRHNFLIKFEKENSFALPDTSHNPLFPKALSDEAAPDVRERELVLTLRLFRAFCSWGGEVENPRMLVPLLRDPFFYAFVARQMAGLKAQWDPVSNQISLVKDKDSQQALCTKLICRRVKREHFERKIPRMIGTRDLLDDYSRLYCQEFRDLDYRTHQQVPQVSAWIRDQGLDEEFLMRSQLAALITGVPDFLVRAPTFQDARQSLRTSLDRVWNQWAARQVQDHHRAIFYEEPLSVEKVDRKLYFDPHVPRFSAAFDVNLGEMDRANQMIGKVHTAAHLELPRAFLAWARREWIYHGHRDAAARERLVAVFNKNIQEQLERVRGKFVIPPWNGDLASLVSREILTQLELYRGNYFAGPQKGMVDVPVVFSYAPFALKYLQYEFAMNGGQRRRGASIEVPTPMGGPTQDQGAVPAGEEGVAP